MLNLIYRDANMSSTINLQKNFKDNSYEMSWLRKAGIHAKHRLKGSLEYAELIEISGITTTMGGVLGITAAMVLNDLRLENYGDLTAQCTIAGMVAGCLGFGIFSNKDEAAKEIAYKTAKINANRLGQPVHP